MSAKLNGKTTRESLERETKDSLVRAIMVAAEADGQTAEATALARLGKAALVATAMTFVEGMAARDAKAARDAEAARQETLAAEKAEGLVQSALQHLLKSANHMIAEANETIAEFQAKVAGSPWGISQAMVWHAEDVFRAVANLREFKGFAAWLAERIEKQDQTAAQIAATLEQMADETLRRCLDDGYRHNSTNALDNIKNMADFRATQDAAKFFRRAATGWAAAMRHEDLAALELAYLRV